MIISGDNTVTIATSIHFIVTSLPISLFISPTAISPSSLLHPSPDPTQQIPYTTGICLTLDLVDYYKYQL
ncbi:hypothetical protein, partial [Bacteroides thetaiotaomicron]|uniref:hypothetical protein n=1 Tax=Bacteroides thetaiotaomicron TaxID=818 RepID=UPI001C6FFA9A